MIELLIYVAIFAIVAGFFTSILLISLRVQSTQTGLVEISGQLNFVMQAVQRHVHDATAVSAPASGASGSTLTITKPSGIVTIALGSCGTPITTNAVCVTEAGNTDPITNDKIQVTNLTFRHYTTPSSLPCPGTPCVPSTETIQINISADNKSQNPAQFVSRTLQGSASPLNQ